MLEGICNQTIEEMIDNGVSKKDFQKIAIEECAELQKALMKDARGYKDLSHYSDLLDSLADNLLATQYLIVAMGLEKEIKDILVKKHNRNMKNASKHNFAFRDKIVDLDVLTNNLISGLKSNTLQLYEVLDATYVLSLEIKQSFYILSIKEYKVEHNFEFKISEENAFNIVEISEKDEKSLKEAIKNVYNKFKFSY